MIRYVLFAMGVLASLLTQGCLSMKLQPAPPAEPEAPETAFAPAYEVRRVSGALTLDGKLDEKVWQTAPPLAFIAYETHETPLSHTEARVLWDDEYLYIGVEAADKDVWSYLEERDAWVRVEDSLLVFIKTDPHDTPYYNFEVNARGTLFDAFSPKPRFAGGYHRFSKWNCEGVKLKVRVRGTLNDPDDVDEGWSLELAIPFRSLPSLRDGRPQPGDTWAINVARFDYSVYLPENGREISACAPLTPRFNEPAEWIDLTFNP